MGVDLSIIKRIRTFSGEAQIRLVLEDFDQASAKWNGAYVGCLPTADEELSKDAWYCVHGVMVGPVFEEV